MRKNRHSPLQSFCCQQGQILEESIEAWRKKQKYFEQNPTVSCLWGEPARMHTFVGFFCWWMHWKPDSHVHRTSTWGEHQADVMTKPTSHVKKPKNMFTFFFSGEKQVSELQTSQPLCPPQETYPVPKDRSMVLCHLLSNIFIDVWTRLWLLLSTRDLFVEVHIIISLPWTINSSEKTSLVSCYVQCNWHPGWSLQ